VTLANRSNRDPCRLPPHFTMATNKGDHKGELRSSRMTLKHSNHDEDVRAVRGVGGCGGARHDVVLRAMLGRFSTTTSCVSAERSVTRKSKTLFSAARNKGSWSSFAAGSTAAS